MAEEITSPASPCFVGGSKKRRRTAQACNECRDRKRKCDGLKPMCSACAKRPSAQCIWNEDRNAKGWWSNSYVESLRSQIKKLEDAQTSSRCESSVSRELPAASNQINNNLFGMNSDLDGGSNMPGSLAENANNLDALLHKEPQARSWQIYDQGSGFADAPPNRTLDGNIPRNSATDDGRSSISRWTQDFQATDDDVIETDSEVDGMGVFYSMKRPDRRRSFYFGPSSTLNFVSQAQRAMNERYGSTSSNRSNSIPSLENHNVSPVGKPRISLAGPKKTFEDTFRFSVPPRTEADALVESYWTWFHSLYPLLHQPSFNVKYQNLWTPRDTQQDTGPKGYLDDMDDKLFHCLLNVIFAMGCYFSSNIDDGDRERISLAFFERAKALIDFEMLAQASFALVQTLLLMAQYLQSTNMSSGCWNMAGLAIRVAQGIGLHHDPESCNQECCSRVQLNKVEIEMRRRVWTGCILLDRILSMTYGRPLIVSSLLSRHAILPEPKDYDTLVNSSDFVDENNPSLTACYVESIKLQDIIGQILAAFYGSSLEDGKSGTGNFRAAIANSMPFIDTTDRADIGDLERLLDLDNAFSGWFANLPPHLKIQYYQDANHGGEQSFGPRTPIFKRQAMILHIRYLHSRMFMFCPVILAILHSGQLPTESEVDETSIESAMRRNLLVKGLNKCFLAAKELVEIITDNMQSARENLPPPWYTVFYMHSCSVVLLITILCSSKSSQEGGKVRMASWTKCLEFFREYQSHSRSAKRCYRILLAMYDQVPALKNQQGTIDDNILSQQAGSQEYLNGDMLRMTGVNLSSINEAHQNSDFADNGITDNMFMDLADANWMGLGPNMTFLSSLVPFLENIDYDPDL